MSTGWLMKPLTERRTVKSLALTIVTRLLGAHTARTSSPSGCHATAVGPVSTLVSATTWWNRLLNGLMSMNDNFELEAFETTRKRRLGDTAMSVGSVIGMLSSTVMRLLFRTTTLRLSLSST